MRISKDAISGRKILITGAGGSIGSALAEAVLSLNPRLLILLDHAERGLYEVDSNLRARETKVEPHIVLGDIRDGALLADLLERHRPEVIFHAAALKHVPLTENNPIAAVQTNALGTATLAKAAAEFQVSDFVMVSTDKAVNPGGIMGASKRVAELVLMRWANSSTTMKSIRLGNVMGSQGSVIPAFQRQIAEGGPVTVTHIHASRYFLTMQKAVEFILAALNLGGDAKILIPDVGEPVQILDLARRMIQESGFKPEADIPILPIGLRAGDKMSESFVADSESVKRTRDPRLFAIESPQIARDEFDSFLAQLGENARQRNLVAVVDSLCRIVPEYQPSETMLRLMGDSAAIET